MLRPRSRYDAGVLVAFAAGLLALLLALVVLTAQPAEAARHWAYAPNLSLEADATSPGVGGSGPAAAADTLDLAHAADSTTLVGSWAGTSNTGAWRRVGLRCVRDRYLLWTVRLCVTVHARQVLGQWEVRAAAASAGYNRLGRRKMGHLVAVRIGGHTTVGRSGGRVRRLVVRGPWVVPAGNLVVVPAATSVHVVEWPNGKRSAYRLYSNP